MIRLIGVVFGKETRDHLRDQRSLMSALLYPLFSPLIFALTFSLVASWSSSDKELKIPLSGGENAPSLIAFLERAGAHVEPAPADYEKKVRDGDLDETLVIPADYAKDFRAGHAATIELFVDGSNERASRTVHRTRRLLEVYGVQVGALRLLARGVSPELAGAVTVDEVDVATKQQQAATLLNMIPVFLLMGAFLAGMHVAIDTMAGERERGSLEPLLVNPITAGGLVAGKWLTTVVFGAVGVVLMLAAFVLAIDQVPLEELGIRASLGAPEIAGILCAMLPLVLFTGALQMLVATFARSFKEAQTYVSLVMFVPILPGIYLSLSPIKPQGWMNLVPTLGQQILVTSVMRGDPTTPVQFILCAAGTLVGAACCLVVTARLLGRERIVFGR